MFTMSTLKTTRATVRIRTESDIELLEQNDYRALVPSRTLLDVLVTNARLHGDRQGLTVIESDDVYGPATSYTHTGILREVTRMANVFWRLGVGRRDTVAILARTHKETPVAIWGAEIAGVASCINYLLSAEVISALLRTEKASALVCPGPDLDPEIWNKVVELTADVPTLCHVLVLGPVPPGLDDRFKSLSELIEVEPEGDLLQQHLPESDDVAALFHTGGTTGVPKLVPQTHANQVHAAWSLAQLFDLNEQDIALNGFPLFHVGGTSTIGLSVLASAGHVVMLTPKGFRNPDTISNIWGLVERYSATVLGGVPTAIGAMSESAVGDADISTLRFVLTGGAPLPKAIAMRFEAATGVPLLEQYGMTETNAALATTPLHGDNKRGSVGLRCPFSELAIMKIDEAGDWVTCERGEVGLVACKGPQVVSGYLDAAHTAEAFTPDGALISGDMGYLDEDGYLYLTGREKDVIIRSGHNIDPASIEEVVDAFETVSLSAAVGMPDEYAGEVPVVFVSASEDQAIDLPGLQEHINQNIHEPPARPRHIFVVDEIPTTGVGKIFKPRLREIAVEHKLTEILRRIDKEATLVEIRSGKNEYRVALQKSNSSSRPSIEQEFAEAISELSVKVIPCWE